MFTYCCTEEHCGDKCVVENYSHLAFEEGSGLAQVAHLPALSDVRRKGVPKSFDCCTEEHCGDQCVAESYSSFAFEEGSGQAQVAQLPALSDQQRKGVPMSFDVDHSHIIESLSRIEAGTDLAISRAKHINNVMTGKAIPGDSETIDFAVLLRRSSPSEPLNLELMHDSWFRYLVIKKPSGGPMKAFQAANPLKKVRRCDQIISVNGTTGDALALLAAMKNEGDVNLILRRYVRFTVGLELTDEPLGLKLEGFVGKGIKVVHIFDGLIRNTWNGSTMPCCDVCVGDELAEVNGMRIDVNTKLDDLQKGGRLQLVFVRPSPINIVSV